MPDHPCDCDRLRKRVAHLEQELLWWRAKCERQRGCNETSIISDNDRGNGTPASGLSQTSKRTSPLHSNIGGVSERRRGNYSDLPNSSVIRDHDAGDECDQDLRRLQCQDEARGGCV